MVGDEVGKRVGGGVIVEAAQLYKWKNSISPDQAD